MGALQDCRACRAGFIGDGAEGVEDMKQRRKSFVVVAAIAAKPANDNRTLYQQLQASLALELAKARRQGRVQAYEKRAKR